MAGLLMSSEAQQTLWGAQLMLRVARLMCWEEPWMWWLQMSWEALLLWWRARRLWWEARQMLWVELSLHEVTALSRHTEFKRSGINLDPACPVAPEALNSGERVILHPCRG